MNEKNLIVDGIEAVLSVGVGVFATVTLGGLVLPMCATAPIKILSMIGVAATSSAITEAVCKETELMAESIEQTKKYRQELKELRREMETNQE